MSNDNHLPGSRRISTVGFFLQRGSGYSAPTRGTVGGAHSSTPNPPRQRGQSRWLARGARFATQREKRVVAGMVESARFTTRRGNASIARHDQVAPRGKVTHSCPQYTHRRPSSATAQYLSCRRYRGRPPCPLVGRRWRGGRRDAFGRTLPRSAPDQLVLDGRRLPLRLR